MSNVIEIERLDKFYGPFQALTDINLTVAQGEVVVVNDKFGIRLTDIITPSERIRKLNK